jgi:PleD family two-component response regulator
MANAKVLIVDDGATQRSVYRQILNEGGYDVIEAKNGKDGLDKARLEKPDVIISDISMPEMDGLEMIRRLKTDAATKFIPIICASATFQDLETKMKALLEVGAEEYFYMPQDKKELLAKVAVMMRIRKIYQTLLETNRQLKQFNDAAVDREMKMIELKEKIKSLEAELGKYKK